MIKIIKHGHPQYKLTCRYCECVFTFEEVDIQNNSCQWDWSEWVICPECNRQNEIYDKNQIKNHSYD